MTSKPLFILGKHRSGTTWLGNQLSQHQEIAGVVHELHLGIHESAYFSAVLNRYGDLSDYNNFVEFVEVIGSSDYFRLAGADKAFLYSLWPDTYEGIFEKVMEKYASEKGSKYWIEKSPTHSVYVEMLSKAYPAAKFISIQRKLQGVLASTMQIHDGASFFQRIGIVFSTVLSWTFFNKTINNYKKNSNQILALKYESFRSDQELTMKKISDFLDIPYDPQTCVQAFAPNTSFTKAKRSEALSKLEKLLASILKGFFTLIPLRLMTSLYDRTKKSKRRELPEWFFRIYKKEIKASSASQNSSILEKV